MPEGYTIAEAAELLGIPQRRVRALIERGVLQGGLDTRRRWRVQLAPADVTLTDAAVSSGRTRMPSPDADDDAIPAGGRPAEGVSNFRDLLAELRHLQERYGQALLALGEARGEAAALRTRVAQLESQSEVRLLETDRGTPPSGHDAIPAAGDPVPPRQVTARRGATALGRPQRPWMGRNRVASTRVTADPERIQDPARFELPGARAAAEALAEFRRSSMARRPVDVETRDLVAVEVVGTVDDPEHDRGIGSDDLRAAVGLRDRAPEGPLERLKRWLAG